MKTRGEDRKRLLKSHSCLNLIAYRAMDSSATQVLTKTVSISPDFALTAFLLPSAVSKEVFLGEGD